MAGSKRMSAEEKRKTILEEVYHKSKTVYTEKEVIALATKAGVNSNTVVDINQSLIDDALVDKEKIGGANYYWSFPAKKDRAVQVQHESTLEAITTLGGTVREASLRLTDAKRGREDDGTGERVAKLQRLGAIAAETKQLQAELDALKENDPQAVADLAKELKLVTEAAHRWTDNIFNCKSYLTKKRGMDRKEACRVLGITAAFDYPEDKVPK